MARSATTWEPLSGDRLAAYWRGREAAWRRARMLDPWDPSRAFNRYTYARLWKEQRGLCGLCDKPLLVKRWVDVRGGEKVGVGRGIDVDHAHSHGKARALLHGRCNRMVGVMDSRHALLVLNYLLRHEGRTEVVGGE